MWGCIPHGKNLISMRFFTICGGVGANYTFLLTRERYTYTLERVYIPLYISIVFCAPHAPHPHKLVSMRVCGVLLSPQCVLTAPHYIKSKSVFSSSGSSSKSVRRILMHSVFTPPIRLPRVLFLALVCINLCCLR